jgi:hypothetical protein
MTPLKGTAVGNKGMGLFTRKIDGRNAMIWRQDNESLYLIYSDGLLSWNGGTPILKRKFYATRIRCSPDLILCSDS